MKNMKKYGGRKKITTVRDFYNFVYFTNAQLCFVFLLSSQFVYILQAWLGLEAFQANVPICLDVGSVLYILVYYCSSVMPIPLDSKI